MQKITERKTKHYQPKVQMFPLRSTYSIICNPHLSREIISYTTDQRVLFQQPSNSPHQVH
jgi:hypothetical protein